ncbi:hypothetical protein NDU88_003202 [Pleurodeles waltl]|uniref:Uncharacterized protein n=1 Tax=Pleurodeles waltl TaxID=8319 RepID=A0AAV7NP28_PLEWA|nr:hypothetical protein NDU88_003202 [Pleurodeles waltl]
MIKVQETAWQRIFNQKIYTTSLRRGRCPAQAPATLDGKRGHHRRATKNRGTSVPSNNILMGNPADSGDEGRETRDVATDFQPEDLHNESEAWEVPSASSGHA